MPRIKIAAGGEVDILNAKETSEIVRGELASWSVEIRRGVKYRLFSGVSINASGTWTLDENTAPESPAGAIPQTPDHIGPRPGYVWAVTRLAVSGPGVVVGTDKWNVFYSTISPLRLAAGPITTWQPFDIPQLLVNDGDTLAFQGAATGTTSGQVFVSGACVEVPVQLAWQLLG